MTLTWKNEDGGHAAVFELDKNDIRSVLAALKVKTGQENRNSSRGGL